MDPAKRDVRDPPPEVLDGILLEEVELRPYGGYPSPSPGRQPATNPRTGFADPVVCLELREWERGSRFVVNGWMRRRGLWGGGFQVTGRRQEGRWVIVGYDYDPFAGLEPLPGFPVTPAR